VPIRQLIYSSRWTPAATRDLDLTLQQIVSASIQNNRLCAVTGFLIAQDGVFLQLLEGPSRGVAETYGRITPDPRHSDVRMICDVQGASRLFQHWNMAGVSQTGTPLNEAALDADAARALLLSVAGQEDERERRFYG
jgi:hypothetical protein